MSGQGACNHHRAITPVHSEPGVSMSFVIFAIGMEEQWHLDPLRAGKVGV